MKNKKPQTIPEYKDWMKENGHEITDRSENYFLTVQQKILKDFDESDYWKSLLTQFNVYDQEYKILTGYPLLTNFNPSLLKKSYSSFIEKTFRKNVIHNKRWPEPPQDGWITPANWFTRVNDLIRTEIVVKYLDGVEFILNKIQNHSITKACDCKINYEARSEGYYAAHICLTKEFEIPKEEWDTKRVQVQIEIQITTQLQEVIRRLLHRHYETNRKKSGSRTMWQWDYRSEEFATNYLGHILHYVEGMIMDIRDKQKEIKK